MPLPSLVRPMRRAAFRVIVMAVAGVALASCGQSGPSKDDAEGALNSLFGAAAHASISDLKCAKTGDGMYNCQVLVQWSGAGFVGVPTHKPILQSYQFVKLNDGWHAKLAH